jgi:chromosomal replication initiation ATPase DnaA
MMLMTKTREEVSRRQVDALSTDNEVQRVRIGCLQSMNDRLQAKLLAMEAVYAESVPGQDVELQGLLEQATQEIRRLQQQNASLRQRLRAERSEENAIVASTTEILTACAAAYGHTLGDIRSTRRTNSISRARHLAWHLMREILPALSLSEAGVLTGDKDHDKDHSTVLYGIRRIDERMETDEGLRRLRAKLFARLSAPPAEEAS